MADQTEGKRKRSSVSLLNDPGGESVQYISKNLPQKGFSMLNVMRSKAQLCDVTIKIGDRQIVAHKAVLAATVPYFYAMFTNNVKESRENVVQLKQVDPTAVEELVCFVYSGVIEVRDDNVQTLLQAASLLQLTEVRDACCEYLQQQLHPSNCLGIQHFADIHSCTDLQRKAQIYSQRHFAQVCQFEEFLNLTCSQVLELVRSNELGVHREEDVYTAVIAWVKYRAEERKENLCGLLEQVRLLLLSSKYLVETVSVEPLLADCDGCKDFIIEAMRYHLVTAQERVDFNSPRCVPRKRTGPPQYILVVGGQAPKAINHVEVFDINQRSCKLGPEMIQRRCRCGAAIIGNTVYAVGGFDGNARVRSAEKFDLEQGAWLPLPNMHCRRSTLGVAVLSNRLYAVGGFDGTNGLDSVECYSPDMQEWLQVAPMGTRRSSVGVGVLNGCLYAVGGYDGSARSCLNTVESYNPELNEWTPVEPMLQKRSGAAVVAMDGFLYAIGGHDGPDIRKTVERFDPAQEKWFSIPDMFNCRRNASAVVVRGLLYVIGGDDGNNNLSSVEVYDYYTNTWEFSPVSLIIGRSYSGVVCTSLLPENMTSSSVPESVSHHPDTSF